MSKKPELIWQKGAVNDLFRLREFLKSKNPKAAVNAAQKIMAAAGLLLDQPYLGQPIENIPEFHKLEIPFGKNGYVLTYRIEKGNIIVLRIWHSREDC